MTAAMAIAKAVSRPILADYLELTKPRLSLLAVLTALVGYVVVRAPWEWGHFIPTMLGTCACAAGVATLNQWMESDTDARMRRTAERPIPAGKIAGGSAFVIGWVLSMAGLFTLFIWASALAALFALLTVITYLAFYTPAKRWSRWSTEIGAVAGALPPLIGWSAADGGVGPLGWILFGVLLFWQIPHFMAIAWTYRHDYAAVDFPMLSVRDENGGWVAGWSFINALLLLAVSVVPAFLGLTSNYYLIVAGLTGLWFLWRAALFLRPVGRDQAARKLFYASIIYLPITLIALVADRVIFF